MSTPAWLLPPQNQSFPTRHPIVTALACLFLVGFVLTYWYAVIPVALIAGGVAVWWGRRHYRQLEHDRLRRAADAAYRNGEVLPPRPPWESQQ